MTYQEIGIAYKKQFNKTIATCFIADAKRELKMKDRKALKTKNPNAPSYPCAPEVKAWLMETLKPKKRA